MVSRRPAGMSRGCMPLVDHCALLEKEHPRCRDRGANVRENQDENIGVAAPGSGFHMSNDRPTALQSVGMSQNRGRDKESVEYRESQRDSFPGPKAAGGDGPDHGPQALRPRRLPGPDTEKAEAGADADKLSDQRKEISQHQVAHREESPEFPEAIEDEFGMAAMSDRAEAHGHLLHDVADQECKHDERKKKADSETRSGGGIGKHAGSIVFAQGKPVLKAR